MVIRSGAAPTQPCRSQQGRGQQRATPRGVLSPPRGNSRPHLREPKLPRVGPEPHYHSQTQIYLWFLAFTIVYLAELGLRAWHTPYFGGISVPARLLALAGVSALTFGVARANTTIKNALSPAPLAKTLAKSERSRLELLQDLFTNDEGRPDLGDFQMIALSGVAILVYLVLSAGFLSRVAFAGHVDLPPVDDTLLGGTATAQGAYLSKKIGSRLGN